MSKLYSLRLKGDDKSTLIELARSGLAILSNGGFVLGRRHNTKTGEITDFGFSASEVASLAETKVDTIQLENDHSVDTDEMVNKNAF